MRRQQERIGYYYSPDDQHYTHHELTSWLPILESLGARWLTLCASADRAIPEAFIRALVEASIEPVIHIDIPMAKLQLERLETLFAAYRRWGVRYVVASDRPNLQARWTPNSWGRGALVDRFLDQYLPVLVAQRAAGLIPVFPPLEPGGDYWDLAFLEAALRGMLERGQRSLVEELTLGIFLWTYGRPLDWGIGGSASWPEARPYHTPAGCQDHRGFRIFEWYAAIARQVAENALPMLVVAGGETRTGPSGSTGIDPHSETNRAVARLMQSGEAPYYVLNFAFYVLRAGAGGEKAEQAWFPRPGMPRPVVAAIQQLLVGLDRDGRSESNEEKAFSRYFLLPDVQHAMDDLDVTAVLELARRSRAVVGCSLREAARAHEVALVGDDRALPREMEDELRRAGCLVHRLPLYKSARTTAPAAADGLPSLDPAMPS